MSWIYAAVRKPTEADGDENGVVLVRWEDGCIGRQHVDVVGQKKYRHVAWMPIPPYTPLPPLPDGYRLLTNYSETPDKCAMILKRESWISRSCFGGYKPERIYCLPITPPWVPEIVTAGVLTPGTWVSVDRNGLYWASNDRPLWQANKVCSAATIIPVAEQPQITGEHACWQVPG